MRVFLMLGWVLGNIWRIVHGSEQIEKREDKNPDQIDKVPEKSGHFDAIGKMLGIALINFFADRKPHVKKHQDAAEHVRAVQSSDREITREVGAVPRTEAVDPLNVFLLDLSDMFGWRNVKKMRPIVRRIVGIYVDRIETDFVFLDVRIGQRFVIF